MVGIGGRRQNQSYFSYNINKIFGLPLLCVMPPWQKIVQREAESFQRSFARILPMRNIFLPLIKKILDTPLINPIGRNFFWVLQITLIIFSIFFQGGDRNFTEGNGIEILYQDSIPPKINHDLKYPYCQVNNVSCH